MKKSDWQYLIDSLLFINIFGIVIIGFLLGLVIPKGSTVTESEKFFLGLHRHDWGDIHFFLSIAFTALVIIHLIFSWKWIKGKAKQIFKRIWRMSLILILFLALLTPLLIWNFSPKYAEKYSNHGFGQRKRDFALGSPEAFLPQEGEGDIVVTGQMTLADLEKATGIPAQTVIEKLDLPKRTKPEETFGQLKKRYGFQLQDVRDIISKLIGVSSSTQEKIETEPEYDVPLKTSAVPVLQKEVKTDEEEHEDKITRGHSAEDLSGILITGQMTLKDIEKQTGIPALSLVEKLGLPSTVPLNERLGRLQRMYPITIQDVRDVVSVLLKESEKRGRN
jgi:hypothetical protein